MLRRIFQPPPQTLRASIGLLALRLFCGYAFMVHGWGKIQKPFSWMGADSGYPGFLQALAALSEFGGGLAWILGLLTPLASFGLACTMAVASYLHAISMKQGFVNTKETPQSAELPTVFLCVALLLLLAGPGRFSLDAALFREKKS